mgnify:CR=1 FL=1
MEQQYTVNLVSEVDASQRDAVAADVEARLGMPREKVLKLLDQGVGPLTKPVAKAVADRVAGAMQAAGISAESVPLDWQSILLLDPPEDAAATTDAEVDAPEFDDSPLETLMAAETLAPDPISETSEPAIDPQVDAIGDGLEATIPAPSVTLTPTETPDTGVGEMDTAEGAISGTGEPEAVTEDIKEPADRAAAPVNAASPMRWLAPLMVVLVGLGLAYLFLPGLRPDQAETAVTNEAAPQVEATPSEVPADDAVDDAVADGEAADESAQDLTDSPQPDADAAEASTEETEIEPDASVDGLSEQTNGEQTEVGIDTFIESEVSDAAEIPVLPEDATNEQLITEAEQGVFEAQLELAKRYATGDGVEQDYTQAATWYERAAAAGDDGAQYELGWLYANGLGVERDLEAATTWYEAAAISGNAEAQYQLGFYRYFGQGGTQDLDEAKSLFRASAEQGVAEARFRLGLMLLEGEGGSADEAEAERWLRLAAEQGIVEAEPYLEQLAEDGPDSAGNESGDATDETSADETSADETSTDEPENTLDEPEPFEEPNLNLADEVEAIDPARTTDIETTDIAENVEPADTISQVEAVVPTGVDTNSEGVVPLVQQAPLGEQDIAFFELAKRGDATSIASAIRAGANVNARDTYGQTPLMYAASLNSPTAVAELSVIANINAQSNAGWTALMYAARDNPDVVATLLNRGADARLTNSDGQTALDIARATGSVTSQLLADAQ